MRLVVFVSGSGSNLQALIDAVRQGRLAAEIVLVVANRKQAYALERAAQAGIETLYFPLKPYKKQEAGREAYDRDLASLVLPHRPDLIVLAGWMHILSPAFLDHFPNRVINLHPALPDMFAGTHAIERAYEAFRRGEIPHSGCMVHYVVPEVDAGPVIVQEIVPLYDSDTLESFEKRMHAAEHRIVVEAAERLLQL